MPRGGRAGAPRSGTMPSTSVRTPRVRRCGHRSSESHHGAAARPCHSPQGSFRERVPIGSAAARASCPAFRFARRTGHGRYNKGS
eukprot:3471398-Prymnesium_polylepis.2